MLKDWWAILRDEVAIDLAEGDEAALHRAREHRDRPPKESGDDGLAGLFASYAIARVAGVTVDPSTIALLPPRGDAPKALRPKEFR